MRGGWLGRDDPFHRPLCLVVDDDPLIMMDTTSILEDAGFRFYEAMDGDEAKRILAANS